MIVDESIMYIGIVAIGAVIVLVTGFLIVKSTSKKDTAQRQPLEKIPDKTALRKRPVPNDEATVTSKVSAFRKVIGGIIKGKGATGKRGTPPDRQSIDQGLAIKEQLSNQSMDLTSLGLQTATLSSLADREALNVEPVTEQETEENVIDTAVIEMDQVLSNAESINEPEPEVNMIGSFSAPVAESAQEEPQEGLEHSEDEPEAEDKAPGNENQEQPKAKDDVFDMFRDEMVEESETSKFAANLDNVDVHDLLDDAQNLANNLGRGKG